jgi:hypothetical protein
MLWVDKHRPTSLESLDYGKEQAEQLRLLAATGDLPHMLFYGPAGAGKKTRIMALVRRCARFRPRRRRARARVRRRHLAAAAAAALAFFCSCARFSAPVWSA